MGPHGDGEREGRRTGARRRPFLVRYAVGESREGELGRERNEQEDLTLP